MRASLCFARACGSEESFFATLPSTYPFSAQARLGPCWAILSSRLAVLLLRSHDLIATFNASRIVAAALGAVLTKSRTEAVLRHFQKELG